MNERLIDAVCPHCGRVGTTVRVVLQEDGHTKLSRRCTDCGGECIHTFDHDWLAAANNKKLRAENERLTSDVALVAERVRQLSEERDYAWAEIEKQRAENERLRAMLPPTAHSGVRSGPGEGSWSVFAEKVVEERDAARAEIERHRADLVLEKSRIVLQRGEIERLRAENERLRTVYVLIASREAGPVDSATCWYEDKIIGCYISREAAEETANLLMADWRINEYALVGKP